jgi:hypothetical protein
MWPGMLTPVGGGKYRRIKVAFFWMEVSISLQV